jgi:hypothetical protein
MEITMTRVVRLLKIRVPPVDQPGFPDAQVTAAHKDKAVFLTGRFRR